MKAVRVHAWGGPDTLRYEDAPRPEAGTGELLIAVRGAGVNPIDCKTRRGEGVAGGLIDPFPVILGWDISGVVEGVGPGVNGFTRGDAGFGMVRFPAIAAGYAECVAASVSDVAMKPATIDHLAAAGVPLVVLTAWQALIETAGLTAGQRVLIHRAAGGVGHIAVQLARWRGAHVIGTASAANAAYVGDLGVDEVIDYRTTRFDDVVQGVDVVFDTVGGETRARSWGVLKPGGHLVSILGQPAADEASTHGVQASGVRVHPDAGQLTEIARLIDVGHLSVIADTVLPLDQAAQAHELSEAGHTRGKIVLQPAPSVAAASSSQ